VEAAATLVAAGIRIGVSISPMLPMRDPGSFGERLAELAAEEYVTQYLKPTRSQFAAGSSAEAWRMMREDGWSLREYRQAREEIARRLGEERQLLEGREGYAPA
jgi:DNA repair photolyase